jgi:O-acetylhomoserine (thiol)-lyase
MAGSYNSLKVTLPRLELPHIGDPTDPSNFTNAAKKQILKPFFVESLGNPKLDVLDLKLFLQAKSLKVPSLLIIQLPPRIY